MEHISFKDDIMPLFKQFKGQMIWRFDLTCYEDMRMNAQTVYDRISNPDAPMPPPPFPPLTKDQIQKFKQWIEKGFPA